MEGCSYGHTEFGVWNQPLIGIYESIYNIEYTMRQLEHTNTQLVGGHEVSSKYTPLKNKNNIIENAFENNIEIDTDTIFTGIRRKLEGKAYKIYHEATNNSDYLYKTTITNNVRVPGLKNTTANGMFAQTYKGINGYNYLVISNRSGEANQYQIAVNGKPLQNDVMTSYISGASLTIDDANIEYTTYKNGIISIKPYSLSVCKWKTYNYKLSQPTIYKATVEKDGVLLKWGTISNATGYKIYYGTDNSNLNKTTEVVGSSSFLVKDLSPNVNYFFRIEALNHLMQSDMSETVSSAYKLPEQPEIFKVSRREDTVTLFWESVPNATGYVINYLDENGKEVEIKTANVFGYRLKGLRNNTTYSFKVTACNGLGKGVASVEENVLVSSRVPFSPRNVSAIKKTPNSIEVKWVEQNNVLPNTCYNVYRSDKLLKFEKIASCVKDTVYVDTSVDVNTQYYYTVKAVTEVGESNFYPNIATTFALENKSKINIQYVQKQKDGYLVRVNLNKMTLKPKDAFGIVINNVSYLNVEDLKILGTPDKERENAFDVFIPNSKIKENSKYAIKAFVISQGEKTESTIVNQYISKK